MWLIIFYFVDFVFSLYHFLLPTFLVFYLLFSYLLGVEIYIITFQTFFCNIFMNTYVHLYFLLTQTLLYP